MSSPSVGDLVEPLIHSEESKEEYDPTARSCGYCYTVLPSKSSSDEAKTWATPCPHCPRLYCSSACRSSDETTHAFWCGKVGEKGVDFEVCQVAGKGLGVITKRPFQRGERILAERPVMTTTNVLKMPQSDHIPSEEETQRTNESILEAAMALTPLDGNLDDKVNNNAVSLGTQTLTPEGNIPVEPHPAAGLFLTFSRVNHDCLGNADHYFDNQHGVELLVANDDIPAFTEVTFPYARSGKNRRTDLHWRGFDCTCCACQTPALDSKVNQMCALDHKVVALGGNVCTAKRAEAVEMAHTLLHLYDEVNASSRDYARVHYDLFQILVVQQESMNQANHHMAEAYRYALSFCGYEGHQTVLRYKEYVNNPEQHGNYRAMDCLLS